MLDKRIGVLLLLGLFMISFSSAEYYVDIYADAVSGAAGGVTVTDLGSGIFRINATNGDYEVDRALVMKWLFYGTDGTDPRATSTYVTNPTKVVSIAKRDEGKRGHYVNVSNINGHTVGTNTGTFTDTTNNFNISSWSIVSTTDNQAYSHWRMPTDNALNSQTSSGVTDELGVDTSGDQQHNPANCHVQSFSFSSGQVAYTRAIILSKDSIGWSSSGLDTFEDTDFFNDESFPEFEYSPEVTLNTPINNFKELENSDIIFNATSTIFGGKTLANITLYINGTLNETKSLSGTEDTETFTKAFSTGYYNWSVRTCNNESICTTSETRDFTISTVKELNLTYNEEVLDLSLEDFILYVQASEEITASKLYYNGNIYDSSILSLGSGIYKISNSMQIPDVAVDTNYTFYFEITTETDTFLTDSYNQSVFVLLIDNCASYTNEIFNISLYDEKTLELLLGTIEVNLELFNNDKSTALTTAVSNFYNMSNMAICSNVNLTGTGYYYDLELRYYVDPTNTSTFLYVPELYHIQKASTENFPQTLNLYNLNINQSTEFTMFYRDDNYVASSGVLLQIERKYISEGIFRTVEIPITSSEGNAIGHFDLNNYKYKIIATLNGEILNVFNNPAIVCESELSGLCTLNLNGQGSPNPFEDYNTIEDISYDISLNDTEITINYVIPSGETRQINVYMYQVSSFADDKVLCNQTLTSSAGSFTCDANSTIGDSNVFIEIRVDGALGPISKVYYQEDLGDYFNLNNYAIGALFLILLITMMVSSPMIMVATSIFSVALLGFVFLLKGSSIGLVLGSFSWLVVAGILILVKLNKKDET